MASFSQMFVGRKRESDVWKHFRYEVDRNKCKCVVLDDKGKECGMLVAGKNPTNMKAHLSRHHSKVFCEMTAMEKASKAEKRKRDEEEGMLRYLITYIVL